MAKNWFFVTCDTSEYAFSKFARFNNIHSAANYKTFHEQNCNTFRHSIRRTTLAHFKQNASYETAKEV